MSKGQESLSRLTLRQLRQQASSLGVPLYSRKTKSDLIKAIDLYDAKKDAEKKLFVDIAKKSSDISDLTLNSISTRVVFLPRDPEWAFVYWEISEEDRQDALEKGATRLSLRLLDVTGKEQGGINKGALREVTVDSHSTEWYLPIPMGDRDYQVELGYRYRAQWISLAFSIPARVPAQRPSELILDQFVPFSLENTTSINSDQTITEDSETVDTGLHQRLYHSATNISRKARIGSEELHENSLLNRNKSNLNESGSGIWASGRNESGIGVIPSENSFWLIADAELIVYGATDPSAKLTIGGEAVPLASDGTFRLQVPFRDGIQNYPIKAIDSEGKHERNITMNFERVTPEDNSNSRENSEVVKEWF